MSFDLSSKIKFSIKLKQKIRYQIKLLSRTQVPNHMTKYQEKRFEHETRNS